MLEVNESMKNNDKKEVCEAFFKIDMVRCSANSILMNCPYINQTDECKEQKKYLECQQIKKGQN